MPVGELKVEVIPGIGKWIMAGADIPRKEYEKLSPKFNPVKFDPAEWVPPAKETGTTILTEFFLEQHNAKNSFQGQLA